MARYIRELEFEIVSPSTSMFRVALSVSSRTNGHLAASFRGSLYVTKDLGEVCATIVRNSI